MEFKLENGNVFATLRVVLKSGEQFKAEAGAMVSMSPGIELEAKTTGKGLGGLLKAAVGGESIFGSLFTASNDGEVVLAPPVPGDILQVELNNQTLFAEGGSYLAGTTGLELSTKGSLKGFLAGEGLFLQKISGTGTVFLSTYGAVMPKVLAPGEKYIVDTGHIVAFEETLGYAIRKAASGLFSTFASGEGLAAEFTGPGRIWIQTRNFSVLAQMIQKLLPGR